MQKKMFVSQSRKLDTQNFIAFENKHYSIKIRFAMRIVELSTLHLMVYIVFLTLILPPINIKLFLGWGPYGPQLNLNKKGRIKFYQGVK